MADYRGNTMYERLTERVENGGVKFSNGEYWNTVYPQNENCLTDIHRMAIRLCEIEDKICEGRMLEFPCAVGQTVYVPWEWNGIKGIATTIVECIQIVRDKKLCGFFIDMKSDDAAFNDIYGFWRTFDDIGKTVFLTPKEANKKLKELENG